jgi:hypothetical protein
MLFPAALLSGYRTGSRHPSSALILTHGDETQATLRANRCLLNTSPLHFVEYRRCQHVSSTLTVARDGRLDMAPSLQPLQAVIDVSPTHTETSCDQSLADSRNITLPYRAREHAVDREIEPL